MAQMFQMVKRLGSLPEVEWPALLIPTGVGVETLKQVLDGITRIYVFLINW